MDGRSKGHEPTKLYPSKPTILRRLLPLLERGRRRRCRRNRAKHSATGEREGDVHPCAGSKADSKEKSNEVSELEEDDDPGIGRGGTTRRRFQAESVHLGAFPAASFASTSTLVWTG
ncbi:hypothetical protein JTE90_019229 [Oedothorax gibbosus]|uniref:Uncharacterized protein n=1 Tax=Oedothorax gibbosus TaxID=931172 RepID=A0AAV6US41_9ARAC|nr:hypothetical protein JTE90_019229 [Oedothorax gibbosus]